MTSQGKRWIADGLAIAAILCSLMSLFALFGMGAPRWTTSLNAVSLMLVALAARARSNRLPGS